MPPDPEWVETWLSKAHNDLSAAQRLTEAEAKDATEMARVVRDFVLSRLPEEAGPGSA